MDTLPAADSSASSVGTVPSIISTSILCGSLSPDSNRIDNAGARNPSPAAFISNGMEGILSASATSSNPNTNSAQVPSTSPKETVVGLIDIQSRRVTAGVDQPGEISMGRVEHDSVAETRVGPTDIQSRRVTAGVGQFNDLLMGVEETQETDHLAQIAERSQQDVAWAVQEMDRVDDQLQETLHKMRKTERQMRDLQSELTAWKDLVNAMMEGNESTISYCRRSLSRSGAWPLGTSLSDPQPSPSRAASPSILSRPRPSAPSTLLGSKRSASPSPSAKRRRFSPAPSTESPDPSDVLDCYMLIFLREKAGSLPTGIMQDNLSDVRLLCTLSLIFPLHPFSTVVATVWRALVFFVQLPSAIGQELKIKKYTGSIENNEITNRAILQHFQEKCQLTHELRIAILTLLAKNLKRPVPTHFPSPLAESTLSESTVIAETATTHSNISSLAMGAETTPSLVAASQSSVELPLAAGSQSKQKEHVERVQQAPTVPLS